MSIVKWDPWRELEDAFDRYATSGDARNRALARHREEWVPRVDITETAEQFTIKAEVPGVKKEDVKVDVNNRVLTIRGERKQEKEEEGEKFHRIERYFGTFNRSFTLPENIDKTKIRASFQDGMLTVHLKKAVDAKPQPIEIKVE